MKHYLIGLSIILMLTARCNNIDNQQLLNQQKLLEYQMNKRFGKIAALYQLNKVKYKELWLNSIKLNKAYHNLKEDFRNNTNEIDKIISFSKQNNYSFDYDNLSFSIENSLKSDDESFKNFAFNNILILINEILYNEIQKSQNRDFHYSNIESYVELDKNYYKVGDRVNAKIFIKAFDTSQRPIMILNNGLFIDSFNNNCEGIYSIIASKKGTFNVNGNIIYLKPGSFTEFDSTNFEFEYVVK